MLIDSITVNFLWGTFFGVLTFDACFPATLCACTAFEISSSSVEICDEMPTTKVSKPSREDSMKKYYDCRYMRTCFCNVTRSLSANARWSIYELSTERWRKAIDISCQSASHHLITSRKVLIYECYWVEVGTIERVLESIHFELITAGSTPQPQFPWCKWPSFKYQVLLQKGIISCFWKFERKGDRNPEVHRWLETVILNEWTTFRCFKKPAAPELFERFSNEKLVGLYEYDFF